MNARPHVHQPLRILVAGNSQSLMVVPDRPQPRPGTYGEELLPLLHERGIEAVVHHTGRWFGLINDLRRRYEDAMRNQFPDVVVLHYGAAEAQPRVVPTWYMRHATTWNRGGGSLQRAYWKRVNPRLWRRVRSWQRWASARVGMHMWRMPPAHFAAELRHVVDMARQETGALVLVVDMDPIGDRLEHWMPGYRERRVIFQHLLHDTVAELADRHGDMVRLLASSADIDPTNIDRLLPDGLHRCAEGHQLLAERLAHEICDWLDGSAVS